MFVNNIGESSRSSTTATTGSGTTPNTRPTPPTGISGLESAENGQHQSQPQPPQIPKRRAIPHPRVPWSGKSHPGAREAPPLGNHNGGAVIPSDYFDHLQKYIPGVWKYELIYKAFFPHSMVNFQKLELLWDVQVCQMEDLPSVVKGAEERAIEKRLKLLFLY